MPVVSDPRLLPGSVTLVGAGPGDPELLTLKAVRAIEAATVLLVDDLVSPEVVALARPNARVVHVGKRGGCKHSTPQAVIEEWMVAAARAGETVVRLKGGDPLIFGRSGEEIEHLRAQGIRVAVINGITAGLAAATALGIPLTHRAQAHGVVFVTGHAQSQGPATHWRALAAAAREAGLTLVIYMGVRDAPHIQSELLAGGLAFDTPAAVVQNASLATQKHACTLLGELTQTLSAHAIESPAVILVGPVIDPAATRLLLQGLEAPVNPL